MSKPPLVLYKSVLRIHRKIPQALRTMGDIYVKAEFRRHTQADPNTSLQFLSKWESYVKTIEQQLKFQNSLSENLGKPLDASELNSLSDEQIGQLYAMKDEIAAAGKNCTASSSRET